jgi:hypothetical protein
LFRFKDGDIKILQEKSKKPKEKNVLVKNTLSGLVGEGKDKGSKEFFPSKELNYLKKKRAPSEMMVDVLINLIGVDKVKEKKNPKSSNPKKRDSEEKECVIGEIEQKKQNKMRDVKDILADLVGMEKKKKRKGKEKQKINRNSEVLKNKRFVMFHL